MTDPSLEHVKRILYDELGLKADEFGIDALTAEQKNVLVPWSAYGVIGNGGFKYFYECELDPLDTARAFRALGLEEVAAACERSLSVFPGGRMPDSKSALDEARAAVDWDSPSLRKLEETAAALAPAAPIEACRAAFAACFSAVSVAS